MNRRTTAWLAAGILAVVAVAFAATGHWARAAIAAVATTVPFVVNLPWRRQAAFALLAILISTTATIAFVFGVDLYLHHRFAQSGGYNIWGYRGDPVGRKQAHERRIAFLGGSVAFGYGVAAGETIPAYLERALNQGAHGSNGNVRVVNLGWNSEGAYSFRYTLQDYEYLRPDAVILYSGYNDLGYNNQVFRHRSAMFRLTGYLPILPVIPIGEWVHLKNLSDTANGKVVFKAGLSDRYATEAADAALRISQALERQLGKLSTGHDPSGSSPVGAADEWAFYVGAIRDAVMEALTHQHEVVVVTEPYISDSHFEQQAALAQMLRTEFGSSPRVHYLNAGWTVDLKDRTRCYDGMHLTAAGNREVAAWLAAQLTDTFEAKQREKPSRSEP